MFKHKHPKETTDTGAKKGGNDALITLAETPTKPAPDKGSIVQGAKSLDFEELIAHRYESFERDITALIESLEDYHASMVHERKARAKAFEKLELFSKHTPLMDVIRTKPSTTSISRSYERTSREHADLFEDKILDYIKEWKDIVSYKFETEMKEMKEYREEKTRRKQQVKQLRTHRDKMLSINKEKAENESQKLSHKEDKLGVASHRYEKHKKILTQIIDELIDGSWKDLYPVMANLYQLEMDTENKKAEILTGLQASIDKLSKITKDQGSSTGVSSNATLWRSLRTDWLNSGPIPTVPTPDEPQPLANTIKTPTPTNEDSLKNEKRNDEEKNPFVEESAKAEREDLPVTVAQGKLQNDPQDAQVHGSQEEKLPEAQKVQPLIDRQAAFLDTETSKSEKERPDESQDRQSGLVGALLPPYFKGEAKESEKDRPGESQDAQPNESHDRQPGLVGSVLPPYYKGEPNESGDAQKGRVDESHDEQQGDPQDKHTGLVGSITSYFKGKDDERDTSQDEQVTDSQNKPPDDSHDKQSGLVAAITPPFLKGEAGEPNESQKERMDDSRAEQQDDSNAKQSGLVGSITSYFKGKDDEQENSQKEKLDESHKGKRDEVNDNQEESQIDQPAAFLDKGQSELPNKGELEEPQKDQAGSREEKQVKIDRFDEFQNDPLREFKDDKHDKLKKGQPCATQDDRSRDLQNDPPDAYAIDKSAAFLIDQPLAFQVADQPVAFQNPDPDDK